MTSFDVLAAAHLDRLVFVGGTVVRISSPKIMCLSINFKCGICGNVRRHVLDGGPFSFPRGCVGKCAGFPQVPMLEDAECEEVQIVKIQEQSGSAGQSPSSGNSAPTSGPAVNRMVEVELRGCLMDSVAAGEIVSVGGVLAAKRGSGKGHQGLHQLVIRAQSAMSTAKVVSSSSSQHRNDGGVAISPLDINEFYELIYRENESFFARLVNSVAPGIFGQDKVKAGILLTLLGGTEKPHMRSNLHLLMVGDPGIGKSQLLRAACQLSQRSVVVTANTSSSCGLTVTLSRDAQSGETMFDAGAVVHGDGGITCIDEIDKGGPAEKNALLEVMEQQTISIAKAGMVFSMPVRTSVLAAGNPRNGRFDNSRGIAENIDMEPALVSRFDLPYLLTNVGAKESAHIAAHVLEMHKSSATRAGAQHHSLPNERPFPPAFVTKFTMYARREIQPVLSHGAVECLKAAYIKTRKEYAAKPLGMPITARHLQSMIRVAEARAKAELRREVSPEDAVFAVALMHSCTEPMMNPAPGTVTGLSKANAKKKSQNDLCVEALEDVMASENRGTFSFVEAIAALSSVGCKNPNKAFAELNDCGVFMQVSGSTYRLRKKAA